MMTNEIKQIHTSGLDVAVRCAMCQNSMKSSTGCDGGCSINESMYKNVMDAIEAQMVDDESEPDGTTDSELSESHEPLELPEPDAITPELEKWIEKIESRRLEDWKDIQREQKELKSEYDSYTSRYRSYSYEEMRDYGHTWGPGCEPEEKKAELPEYYKIQDKQLAILKEMVQDECFCDADIEYIFLSKSGWDDEYKICKMGEGYTMQDVLVYLLKYYRCEADFYKEKAKL